MTIADSVYKVLHECCQYSGDDESLCRTLEIFNEWERLLDRSFVHGVLPLVYARLNTLKCAVPPEALLTFKKRTMQIARTNMVMSSELIKICQRLKAHDIETIAFKGPALSQLIYTDMVTRQYADLDILVDENAVYEAVKLLVEDGFELTVPLKFLKNKSFLQVTKDITLINEALHIHAELHWRLFDKKMPIKKSTLYYDFQPISLGNSILNTLNRENLILYLCIHGSKHFLERLEWIVDIDRFIRHNENIDWGYVQKEAESMHSKRMVYLGLLVSYRLFKTPLPQNVLSEMPQDKAFLKMSDKIIDALFNDSITYWHGKPVDLESIEVIAALADCKSYRIRSLLHSYFHIKTGDVLMVNLPNCLSWLYYVIRPFRLLKKYVAYFFKKTFI